MGGYMGMSGGGSGYGGGIRIQSSSITTAGGDITLGGWRWPVVVAIAFLFLVSLGLPLFTLVWQSLFANVTPPRPGPRRPAAG